MDLSWQFWLNRCCLLAGGWATERQRRSRKQGKVQKNIHQSINSGHVSGVIWVVDDFPSVIILLALFRFVFQWTVLFFIIINQNIITDITEMRKITKNSLKTKFLENWKPRTTILIHFFKNLNKSVTFIHMMNSYQWSLQFTLRATVFFSSGFLLIREISAA